MEMELVSVLQATEDGTVRLMHAEPHGKVIVKSVHSAGTDAPNRGASEYFWLQKLTGVPGVPQLLAAWSEHLTCHLVLEFMPRGDVFDCLIRNGVFSVPDILRCASDVLYVLHHMAGALGAVHGDVSLENILIADDGSFRLCDFALAFDITGDGIIHARGKDQYMAPELRNPQGILADAAARVDVFSLGVCLFAMAYGTVPFGNFTDMNGPLVGAFRQGGTRYIVSGYGLKEITELTPLLDRLLAFDPQDRFAVPEAYETVNQLLQTALGAASPLPPSADERIASVAQVCTI